MSGRAFTPTPAAQSRRTAQPNRGCYTVDGGLAGFTFSADYWRFEYSNLITREQAQAIVNADPFDPRIVRSVTGDIQIINIDFINAASLVADGIDIAASYVIDMGDAGSVRAPAPAAYTSRSGSWRSASAWPVPAAGAQCCSSCSSRWKAWAYRA